MCLQPNRTSCTNGSLGSLDGKDLRGAPGIKHRQPGRCLHSGTIRQNTGHVMVAPSLDTVVGMHDLNPDALHTPARLVVILLNSNRFNVVLNLRCIALEEHQLPWRGNARCVGIAHGQGLCYSMAGGGSTQSFSGCNSSTLQINTKAGAGAAVHRTLHPSR